MCENSIKGLYFLILLLNRLLPLFIKCCICSYLTVLINYVICISEVPQTGFRLILGYLLLWILSVIGPPWIILLWDFEVICYSTLSLLSEISLILFVCRTVYTFRFNLFSLHAISFLTVLGVIRNGVFTLYHVVYIFKGIFVYILGGGYGGGGGGGVVKQGVLISTIRGHDGGQGGCLFLGPIGKIRNVTGLDKSPILWRSRSAYHPGSVYLVLGVGW